jgi:hypothetical protein
MLKADISNQEPTTYRRLAILKMIAPNQYEAEKRLLEKMRRDRLGGFPIPPYPGPSKTPQEA